jgi:hypothetical protein
VKQPSKLVALGVFAGAFVLAWTHVGLLWAVIATAGSVALVLVVALAVRLIIPKSRRIRGTPWEMAAIATAQAPESDRAIPGRLYLSRENLLWEPSKSDSPIAPISIRILDIRSAAIRSASFVALTSTLEIGSSAGRTVRFVVTKRPGDLRRIYERVLGTRSEILR